MNAFKFTVYDLKGQPKQRYIAIRRDISLDVTQNKGVKRHHIIIVDRSGSMSFDMPALKESLKKILALHEYNDENIVISLISYSSYGDLATHFVQKPVFEIREQDINQLRASGLTCISQSLTAVRNLIDPSHVTGITLHSDGFANHPSSFSEKKSIFDACDQLSKENVFVNTIAHTNYADFQLLSGIANKVSGKCVSARAIKDLYDSIISTFDALKKGSSKAVSFPLQNDDYLLYISPADGKIIGSSTDLNLVGVDPKNPGTVWGLKKVDESQYSSDGSAIAVSQNALAVYAFARAKLAEGNINEAKYVMASTGDFAMFDKHGFASTAQELALWAIDLEKAVFVGNVPQKFSRPVILDDTTTVMDVLRVIDEFKDGIALNVTEFLKGYTRRGVKRIQGERGENGNLIEPWLQTEVIGDTNLARITGLDISMTSANASINTTQKVRLVKKADKSPISNVAGIMVDNLNQYKSYNIIADGELVVKSIPVLISTKQAFNALMATGMLFCGKDEVKAQSFDATKQYTIALDGAMVTKLNVSTGNVELAINRIFVTKVLLSLLDAIMKEKSAEYTSEQIAELQKHYLSKNLYLNFPTTNEYTDLEDAIATGKIDVRSSYKVKIGVSGILGLDAFRSANEFLDRLYAPNGWTGDKVKCPLLLEKYSWTQKTLSKKAKSTVADDFQKKIFDGLVLKTKQPSDLAAAMSDVVKSFGIDIQLPDTKGVTDLVQYLSSVQSALSKYADKLYMDNLFPVVFFIGAFGMIPDDWDAKAISAEDLKKEWPEVKLSKDEAEGVYYKVGNAVFGVNTEKRYVTIDR